MESVLRGLIFVAGWTLVGVGFFFVLLGPGPHLVHALSFGLPGLALLAMGWLKRGRAAPR